MTFTVRALICHPGHPPRDVVVNIAGCRDAEHAKEKMRDLYPVQKIKTVKAVEP